MKKLTGVIVALIFVMLVFLPVVDNNTTANGSNSSNIKTDVANNNLHWININMNNTGYNIKNATGSYAIYNNRDYTMMDIKSNIPDKDQNKVSVIMGRGFETVLKTEINAVSVFTVISTHGNLNNFINQNSTLIISNGKISMEKIKDPSAHKSFGWGQAWMFCSSQIYYGAIGARNYAALMGLIATDGGLAINTIAASIPFVDVILVGLEAAVVVSWVIFINDHPTTNGREIPYVDIGFSEGKWWDFWDTGAYGEIGAYSNQAYNFNGKLTYSGQYLYFPFLTSEPPNSPNLIVSLQPHSSIWPSVCPPW